MNFVQRIASKYLQKRQASWTVAPRGSAARNLISKTLQAAKSQGLSVHVIVSDPKTFEGGSAHLAHGEAPAVRNARAAQRAWEKSQGFDPDHSMGNI